MRNKGFTLLETLLVTVIITVVLVLGISFSQQKTLSMQVDRTTLQMQQILSAGLAYYVNNGKWPTTISILVSSKYLGTGSATSPWGVDYTISNSGSDGQGIFTVSIVLLQSTASTTAKTVKYFNAIATIIAGRLPFGSTIQGQATDPSTCTTLTTPVGTTLLCPPVPNPTVSASISVPVQDLNNSTAVNFAGLYHHGGCIPVPNCPKEADGTEMTPQVFVIPIAVAGVNDNTTTGTSPNVYPLSSFTAYATASDPINDAPPACSAASSIAPACPVVTALVPFFSHGPANYWRACVDVVTERGNVASTRTDADAADYWGQSVTLAAFTRCSSATEKSGTVYTEPAPNGFSN